VVEVDGKEGRSKIMQHAVNLLKAFVMFLFFQSPPGFMLLNFSYSHKAHYEFSGIHTKILHCVLQDEDTDKQDAKQK